MEAGGGTTLLGGRVPKGSREANGSGSAVPGAGGGTTLLGGNVWKGSLEENGSGSAVPLAGAGCLDEEGESGDVRTLEAAPPVTASVSEA
jgi:hypothetical protein